MNRTLYIFIWLPYLPCRRQPVLANLNIYALLFMFIVFILIYDTQIKDRNLASPTLMRLNKARDMRLLYTQLIQQESFARPLRNR